MTMRDFAPLSIVNNEAKILSTSQANSFRKYGSVIEQLTDWEPNLECVENSQKRLDRDHGY